MLKTFPLLASWVKKEGDNNEKKLLQTSERENRGLY